MGTQIIYTENQSQISPTALTWPATYTNSAGATVRMPNPSMPINYGYKTNSILVEFESGHEQRRKKGETRKTFEFTYVAVHLEVADAIEEFFMECGGPVRSFNWVDPVDKKSYVVRFDGDSFAREYFGHSAAGPIFKIAVKLTQVL